MEIRLEKLNYTKKKKRACETHALILGDKQLTKAYK